MTKKFEIKRVMHELKKRRLEIIKITELSDSLRKITFTGSDLKDFVSLSADDHIKIFLNINGEDIMRDYTPLHFNKEKLELEILFALHRNGPASKWASDAKVGDRLIIGGPKGSTIIPHIFKQYFFIVDETGIPSTLRRTSELNSDDRIDIYFLINSEKDKFETNFGSNAKVNWILNKDLNKLQSELKELEIIHGDYFGWVYGERQLVTDIKHFLINDMRLNENCVKSSTYWSK